MRALTWRHRDSPLGAGRNSRGSPGCTAAALVSEDDEELVWELELGSASEAEGPGRGWWRLPCSGGGASRTISAREAV